MDTRLLSILIGAAFGLVIGIFVARKSARAETVQGGSAASILHYLACAAFSSSFPSAIAAIITRQGIGGALLNGLGFALLSLVFCLLYAVVERPARAHVIDEGWTEAKARQSGL